MFAGCTMVFTVALLLPGDGSVVALATVTVSTTGPATEGMTTMVIVAWPPFGTVPRLHSSAVPPAQEPWLELTETRVMPGGRVSATVTPEASSGPVLPTTIEYVSWLPTVAGAGVAPAVIDRARGL